MRIGQQVANCFEYNYLYIQLLSINFICEVKDIMCKDTVGTNSLSKICKSCGSEFVPFSIEQRSCQNCLDKFVQVERELQTKFPNRKISYCSVCGRPFIKRGTQSICSEVHFVKCCICGKSYEVKQFDKYGNPSPKTCSTVCSTELRKQTNLERFGVDNPSKAKEIQDKKKQTTLKHFGVMYPAQSKKVQQKMQNTMVERYGVEHPYQSNEFIEKAKQTCIDRYGTDNYTKTDEYTERVKETNLRKYGTEYAISSPEVRDKIVQSNISNFGVDNPLKSPEIRDKVAQTNLSRYGTENPFASKSVQRKIQQTNLARFGVENPSQNPDIMAKTQSTQDKLYGGMGFQSETINDKIKQTTKAKYGAENYAKTDEYKDRFKKTTRLHYGVDNPTQSAEVIKSVSDTVKERYGVEWACQLPQVRKSYHTISKVNKAFAELLSSTGIAYSMERNVVNRSYDFAVANSNYLVEINPTITHNSFMSVFDKSSNGLAKNYHLDKTNLARQGGFTCLHVWDWDDWAKVVEIIKPKSNVIYARKCEIRELDTVTCREFLQQHHLQGSCRGQTVRLGLYYQDKLVMVMTFGKPRYNKKFEWELLRLCTKSDMSVVGGAERLWKYFLAKYTPNSVISYCDNAKFSGEVYTRLGMALSNVTPPNKHWYNLKTKEHITNNLLLQKGFDNLFGTDFGKGTDNEQLMLESGWLPIYDCGQMVFTYWK